MSNKEKENYYFDKCTAANTLAEARVILESIKNSLSVAEFVAIDGRLTPRYSSSEKANLGSELNTAKPTEVVQTKEQQAVVSLLGFHSEELQYGYSVARDGAPVLRIKACTLNYTLIIRHRYPTIRFNVFDRLVYLGNAPITNNDVNVITNKLHGLLSGYNCNVKDVERAISIVANENQFNPLKEYFETLPITESNHLDNWMARVTGCLDTELNRTLGRKWLISAVARAICPGCKVEGTLIFTGEQGIGKSTFFQTINPLEEYYCGSKVDISNTQKACQTYQGKFIVEFAELSNIRKQDVEDVKNYLTNTTDTYVPKFENRPVNMPRMCIFGGSTNKEDILADPTGNRRFWVVKAEKFDNVLLSEIKAELWSEAYQAYRKGEIWHLTSEEREALSVSNSLFEMDDPKTEYLREELAKFPDTEFSAYQLLTIAKGFDKDSNSHDVARSMLRLGWSKKHLEAGNKYIRPLNN